MSVKTSLPFLFALAAMVGCSSSSSSATPDGGITNTDGGKQDGGGTDGGKVDISGTKDIAVTVVQYATPTNTPLANCSVRAQVPGNANAYLDAKTDAMGVAHLKVDPAKGPFDITAANAGFTAISVLGVTDSVPGTLVVSAIGAMPSFKEFAASGSITGAGATTKLQIDAWDWQTVVTMPGAMNYTTKFDVSPGLSVPIPVSAIEVDTANTANGLSAGTAVNGSITMPVMRQSQAMTINITLPTTKNAPTMSTVKMNWPTAGLFTKASIKGAGAPVQDMHIGSGIVEKLTTAEAQAAMFCGIANVDPMDNTLLHLQTFGGDMSPDIAGTEVTTVAPMKTATAMDYAAIVYAHDLTGTPTLNIGAVNKLAVGGASLGDATIEVDSDGYDTAEFFISSKQGMTSTTIWVIYAPGGKLAARGLPYLPGGVQLGDLGGDVAQADVAGQVVKYVKNGNSPWQAIVQDQGWLIGNALGTTLDPMGR